MRTYSQELDRLAALLYRRGPMTAAQIAKALKCSKPTVYARLRGLELHGGETVTAELEPAGKRTGPRALRYSLTA